MKERRSCSKLKPWLYFTLELVLFATIALIVYRVVHLYVSPHFSEMAGIFTITVLLYRTKAIQRLERVLERTEEVRRTKVRERYETLYA